MIEFIVAHQLNIMLGLCGSCAICAVFVTISHTFTPRKKRALLLLELSAMGLLMFDQISEIYNGDPSELAFWAVRISNFLIYFFTVGIVFFFNLYLAAVIKDADDILVAPRRLQITNVICFIGAGLVVISQFTGLYYTFDASNTYQRAPGFLLCYVVPILVPVIQLTYILRSYWKLSKGVRLSLILFPLVPLIAGILQMLFYGILLTDISLAVMSIVLYVFSIRDVNATVEETKRKELEILKQEEGEIAHLFDQIITAFVSAVDAKDKNRKGHAARVAVYARKLAQVAGKSKDECDVAYLSALLHDVGKIAIPDQILRKKDKLTQKEKEVFNRHVIKGRDILAGIREFPYLKDAAGYHHEWYDGTGFPGEFAGDDIPELARLVAVVDSYDDMSSIREDRDPLPQQVIREEIVKGSGKHFDPFYAKAMISLIDSDKDYQLREHHEEESTELEEELVCRDYRSKCSFGIPVTDEVSRITFCYESTLTDEGGFSAPSIILFDAMDGRVHTKPASVEINQYTEFGEVWFDGHLICTRARDMKIRTKECETEEGICRIEVVHVRDHARVSLIGGGMQSEVIVALPDSSGEMFVSLTGENVHITKIHVDSIGITLQEGDIPRIVDEITYIDRMVGDVPNIQIDGYCSVATAGMSITDRMEIVFHTMTLPGANLVWHCPFLVFFKSEDNHFHGPNYDELAVVRLDGESVESGGRARSMTEMKKCENFENWDAWKAFNKKGFECKVTIRRYSNRIVMHTENAGIDVRSTIYLEDRDEDVRVAVTGDKCALTDIRFIA